MQSDAPRNGTGNGSGDAAAPMPSEKPLGLRDQVGATIAAARRLVNAHIALAKAEGSEIAGEVGRLVGLFALALGFLLAVGMLLAVGLPLFLAEWLFGSIGWGVLLGLFLLLDLAIVTALVALGVSKRRLAGAFLIGALAGVAVGAVLAYWTDAPRTIEAALGTWLALVAWPILAGIGVARAGIDGEALKQRFIPDQTIELTKETIEWVRARTPLVPKS